MFKFLFFIPLLLPAQTVSNVFVGPTYGTKVGMVTGFQTPIGVGINNFNIIELKFNKNAQPLQSLGFGFSKSMWDHSFKSSSAHLLALTTAGMTSGTNATTAMFNGGFIGSFKFSKNWGISFGFIAQSGSAKGNLYGLPLVYFP